MFCDQYPATRLVLLNSDVVRRQAVGVNVSLRLLSRSGNFRRKEAARWPACLLLSLWLLSNSYTTITITGTPPCAHMSGSSCCW